MNLSYVCVMFIVVTIFAKMNVLADDTDTHDSAVKLNSRETGSKCAYSFFFTSDRKIHGF